jgi:guanylate kinase
LGHIFALAGPSGVGKTTFLSRLFSTPRPTLKLLVRSTARPKRGGEVEGVDYNFYSRDGFLQKLFANDFVHVEQHGSDLFGIETKPIEEAIQGEQDAILLAGIFGATRLKTVFGGNVSVIYMHTGTRQSLLNPECLLESCPEIQELRRRLHEKILTGVVALSPPETAEAYVARRIDLNSLGYAYVNGRIRSGDEITVIENLRDKLDATVEQFEAFAGRRGKRPTVAYSRTNLCFVLMPFTTHMQPVYQDHVVPIVRSLGLDCVRADGIFSSRPIVDDILDAVKNARIVISDLTARNPNVFYETGICHALGKVVILITQDEDVPFDLRHIRHIRYEFTPRGMAQFEHALEQTLRTILAT